jgi:3-oxoacyl-[acyl-carrier protein] reductase
MKTILITGCSRGIGFEFVKVALNHNHNVIAISRNTSSLNTIENKNLHIYKGDISNLNDVLVIKNDLINKSIKLDSIINNAGYLVNKPFLEISQEEIYEMINVNFVAPVNIVKSDFITCGYFTKVMLAK